MAGEKRHLKAVKPATAEEAFLLNEKCLNDIIEVMAQIGEYMEKAEHPLHLGGPALLLLACETAGQSPLGKDLVGLIAKHLHISVTEPTRQ